MKIRKSRQRDSVSLSEEGKITVRKAKYFQPWSTQEWADKAYVSISTLKRFLKGDKIERANFDGLCKVFHLDPNAFIAPPNDQLDSATPSIPALVPPPPVPVPPEPPFTRHSDTPLLSFMITGTFSPNNLAEIKVVLVHLKKLLRDSATFTLVPEHNSLAVTGTFTEDKKPQIEIALVHLEKLLLEHSITYN